MERGGTSTVQFYIFCSFGYIVIKNKINSTILGVVTQTGKMRHVMKALLSTPTSSFSGVKLPIFTPPVSPKFWEGKRGKNYEYFHLKNQTLHVSLCVAK